MFISRFFHYSADIGSCLGIEPLKTVYWTANVARRYFINSTCKLSPWVMAENYKMCFDAKMNVPLLFPSSLKMLVFSYVMWMPKNLWE